MNNLDELNGNEQSLDKPQLHSAAQLAFIGDAVYEMLVRAYIVEHYDYNVNVMHRKAINFVKAQAQATYIKELESILSEDEMKIFKRGRNAKITSAPKNQDMMDYRYATGFETLFGHLYLTGQNARLIELFNEVVKMEQKLYKDKKDKK